MSVKLLTERYWEFLSLKGRCTGSSESTLVKCHIVGNHMSRLILSIVTAYHHDDKQYDANDEVTELLKYTYWFIEIAIMYVCLFMY